MSEEPRVAIAVVGLSAILPDAPNVDAFWSNLVKGRYSITDVDPSRWDPALYYDPDRNVPDKTYSKIGGWVRDWTWDPMAWHLPIPPRVSDAMDDIQKWAISLARSALADYGWPARAVDFERTGVILGNALAGENQWVTMQRVATPEYERDLAHAASFASLPATTRSAILEETRSAVALSHPPITEDTMPGELANVIAGRVANVFDMHGPNYVCDAACASALAAMNAAVEELIDGHCDVVLTGGLDRTMNATAFVKFCKIGALSATGTRPYAEGADGFVMGEGGGMFVLKRLADAERDGDRIYAVVRGLGGSSDGKGKGITAPNPIGQKLAVERAWQTAGLSPATATMIEGHGTSTKVGDTVEVESLAGVLQESGAATGSVGLGSVKSNIGHLKAAAGAAGLLKTVLALHHKVVPASLHCERTNPDLDFAHSPLRVVTSTEDWSRPPDGVRRAGVSAFGFGGTNFHAVLEEFVPGRLDGKRVVALGAIPVTKPKPPIRGAAVIGAATEADLRARLERLAADAQAGREPARQAPAAADLLARERIAIDFGTAKELAEKCALALRADGPAAWKALRSRGVFRGSGPPPKVAFLFTGQGSQYANMLGALRRSEPIVGGVFDEADDIMSPLLGRKLSDVIFVDGGEAAGVARAEAALRQTEITQPAVMTVDLALTRLLDAYGIRPDMVMGHSLGEYGALMAAQSLTFEHTLEAVSARGREMSQLTVEDRGVMAAVIAPLAEIEKAVAAVDSGVVIANVNSTTQGVIGGPSVPVRKAMVSLTAAGFQVVELPVSHAFHTSIVAPASGPLKQTLQRLELRPPQLPIVSNVTGKFYPTGSDVVPLMLELLGRQVAEPVQFVAGLRTLYEAGARVFVEVGPKRALQTFAEDVLGGNEDVVTLFTNHPKTGEYESFNQALCGLYAAGLGTAREEPEATPVAVKHEVAQREPVVITGAALGLPGTERVFDDGNLARILAGEVFIDVLPTRFRRAMLAKHVTRLVKREGADPTFETIDKPDDVIRLAARAGAFDLASEFGVPDELVDALDRTTQLAIGAGIDAMRDAGIPLVMHYRKTKSGTQLPEHWTLADTMRDDTGVICASAMPGLDRMTETVTEFERAQAREQRLADLESLRAHFPGQGGAGVAELDRRITELRHDIEKHPYEFDRRFLFRVLSMGHSQFAQLIGARGPNTQINAACASTTQAIGLAQDWIRAGRCRRVLVIAADDATSEHLMEWVGSGFLASGAAATDDVVEDAAVPFDRRRHGMVIGMGAAAMVVESAAAARERGITPICDVLATVTANSAFHGTRLDPKHISQVMETLVGEAERECGVRRADIASSTVFISHETYTPARGGSAAAEVDALRSVFGAAIDDIVVANTKGFTGHPMGVGIEDVVAVKSLETGIVPPVPNFKERDPDLGPLNLSRGGSYEPAYALRLAAGFGSQISMALLRRVEPPDRKRRAPDELGYAYRIADRLRWQAWLQQSAGRPDPELEVVNRALRIKEVNPATKPAEI
ncbi:MAG TPA: beta-ketoacyl synthase N-terminal-like domain-containing protein, partial [Candidatus Dormibacteraeota bacterium]|nr:beta-ketoacyl synthase N-terminal-like domain-containing protein [Candidatus Dormibacteraeota bacterium]